VLHQVTGDKRGQEIGHGTGAKNNSGSQVIPVEIHQNLRQRRADDGHGRAEQGKKREEGQEQGAEARFDQIHVCASRTMLQLACRSASHSIGKPSSTIRYSIAEVEAISTARCS